MTAMIFPQDTIKELCEQLNRSLEDNPEWRVTDIDIMKHDNGTYSAVLGYTEDN